VSVKVSVPVSLPKAVGVKVMLTLAFLPSERFPAGIREVAGGRDAADIERGRACVFQRHRLGRAGRADRLIAKTQRVRRDPDRRQTALNTYLRFIESGEIYEAYPKSREKALVIRLVGKYEMCESAVVFFKKIEDALVKTGHKIERLGLAGA
jgi:hypothetical protein